MKNLIMVVAALFLLVGCQDIVGDSCTCHLDEYEKSAATNDQWKIINSDPTSNWSVKCPAEGMTPERINFDDDGNEVLKKEDIKNCKMNS